MISRRSLESEGGDIAHRLAALGRNSSPEGDVIIECRDGMLHFTGLFQDSTSMQYGDTDTNEYDRAEYQVDPARFTEALAEARNGGGWEEGPIQLRGSSLSVGTRSIYAPGPATARLGSERLDLLLLDSYEAAFSSRLGARTAYSLEKIRAALDRTPCKG
jgi:hypothetical protein